MLENDKDRKAFLKILSMAAKRYNWIIHAYCLMDDHRHLMVETPNGNLSLGMKQFKRSLHAEIQQDVQHATSSISKNPNVRECNKEC